MESASGQVDAFDDVGDGGGGHSGCFGGLACCDASGVVFGLVFEGLAQAAGDALHEFGGRRGAFADAGVGPAAVLDPAVRLFPGALPGHGRTISLF